MMCGRRRPSTSFTKWMISVLVATFLCEATSLELNVKPTGKPSTTTEQPSPTSTAATIGPARNISYVLELFNSGPVVQDSQIIFSAFLKDHFGHFPNKKLFQYEWSNTADGTLQKMTGNFNVSLQRKFSSDVVLPGMYLMTVVVYSKEKPNQSIVAYKSIPFVITKNLNGMLHLHQKLNYQRENSTFAAGKTIRIHANVSDKFTFSQDPVFQYFWYKNDVWVESTTSPYYDMPVGKSGKVKVKSLVYADFDQLGKKNPQASNAGEKGLKLPKGHFAPSSEKLGNFIQHISVKDTLDFMRIDGDSTGVVGNNIRVNVTCYGSFPTSICWNVTSINVTDADNITCPPGKFVNTCIHHLEIKINSTGWQTIWFTVYNDISILSGHYSVYVYDPGSGTNPLLTVPIVFSVLGLAIILIGAAYILRLRKKPFVEVADFDFYPMLSQENSRSFLSTVAVNVKTAWSKDKHESKHKLARYKASTAKRYGSFSHYEAL